MSRLPEIECAQLTLGKWAALHPKGLRMQPDAASEEGYDKGGEIERGEKEGKLMRTERASWQDKSWGRGSPHRRGGQGLRLEPPRRASCHQRHCRRTPVVLVLAADGQSFAAFERPAAVESFTLTDDVLTANGKSCDFFGCNIAARAQRLKPEKKNMSSVTVFADDRIASAE